MRKLSLLLCFLISALAASAQVLTEKTGVIVQPETYFSGSCSSGRVGTAKETGNTYVCTNGQWKRASVPACSPDPPSGACNSSICLSTYAGTPSIYACVNSAWSPVGSAVGGGSSLLSGVITVGPGTDSNGDGLIGIAEGSWNYNCSYNSDFGMYNLEDCLNGAVAQIRNDRNKPTIIMIMPGRYVTYNGPMTSLTGKSWFTITGLSRDSVVIEYYSGDPVFDFDITAHDFTIENMSIGGGQDKTPTIGAIRGNLVQGDVHINNIDYNSNGTVSGLWYVQTGANAPPGPRVFFSNNTCHGGHYCLDLFSTFDTDHDGITNAYASYYSNGNVWSVEGYAVMPVDILGGRNDYYSSGDTYSADCMAVGVTYNPTVTGTISGSSPRNISISGASFYIGNPTYSGMSRHTCVYPNGGPAAIVLSSANGTLDVTGDSTIDNIQITGSSFVLEREPTQPYTNVFLHRGANAKVYLTGNSVRVDDPTGYSFARRTQVGSDVILTGNTGLAQDIATSAYNWHGFFSAPVGVAGQQGLVLADDAILTSVNSLTLRAEGKSGGVNRRITLNSDPTTYTTDNFGELRIESSAIGVAPATASAVTNKETHVLFRAKDLVFESPDSSGAGGGGVRISTNYDGTGMHFIPSDPFDYGAPYYLGDKTEPWNFLTVADSAANARVAQLRVVGSGVEWWIDTNNDGAVNSGDVCIGDGGADADCNGTQDITGFFAGQAKGALAGCTSGAACYMSLNGVAATTTTESDVYLISPASGFTVRSLQCRLPSAVASGTYTFVVRTAGTTDSSVTCNITSSATQCSDTAHTLTVAANTLMTVKLYGASTPTAEDYGLCTVGYTLF